MITVYLSGGMRTGWQNRVMDQLPASRFSFIDPRNNNTKDPSVYTPWDIFGVSRADVVLCYLEYDNPSGAGLAFEAGYAKGLGKHVITVIEPSNRKYFDIVRLGCDVDFSSLNEAINYLETLV